MPKIWETPLEKTSRAQESWREQERVRESSRNTLTAKMDVFGFLELVLHQGEFRVQFEERFCFQSQDEMVKTTRALSPPSTKGSWCSSFLLESSQPYWADFLQDFLPEEAAGVGCSHHP